MNPATILERAKADGVTVTLSPAGTLKAAGEDTAVTRWLPVIREHKPGIVKTLQKANDPAVEARAIVQRIALASPGDWTPDDIAEAHEAIDRDPAGWRDCFAYILQRVSGGTLQ